MFISIIAQTSLGERSAATPAGKATAEDPRRVVFSSVADSMKNELQFFTVARGKRPYGAIPDGNSSCYSQFR